MEGTINLKPKQADQIYIFESILKQRITQKEAAEILALSPRQVRRKLKRYIVEGKAGLIHKNKGKASNRKTKESLKDKVIGLLKSIYKGYGPTLASEKLREYHDIYLDHETLRRIMIAEDLHITKKRKLISHIWRERKHNYGELIQIDGSYHRWFNDERYCTLIAFIDDATSKVELLFSDYETNESLIAITRSYLVKHGRPLALYADRGRVYKVTNRKDVKKRVTQFERMLKELDIRLIHAYSPQAKGRVERLFKTLQDRLIKELELRNIKTIDEANKFLQEKFIDQYNEKFSIEAISAVDLHRKLDGYDLNTILCIKEKRILNNDRTISYKNKLFLLDRAQPIQLLRNSKVTVLCNSSETVINLVFNGNSLKFREIEIRKPRVKQKIEKIDKRTFGRKAPANHPWKTQKPDISNEFKRGHF
jgi:transposase InsO family protein